MSNNFYTAFGTYIPQHKNCVEGFEDTTTTNTFTSTLTEAPVETTTIAPVETTTIAPIETTTVAPVETTTVAPSTMNDESVNKLAVLLTDIGENITQQMNRLSKIVIKLNEIKKK